MTRRVTHALLAVATLGAIGLFDSPRARAQSAPPASGQVAIPDSPAGRLFRGWLEAFNSGDSTRIGAYYEKYLKTYLGTESVASQLQFRATTGGFDLLGIQVAEARHLEVLVKERKSETTARGLFDVGPDDPAVVTKFGLRAVPRGATVSDFRIDGAERARAIDGAIANLNEFYVYPDVAKKMEEAVRAHQKHGDYDSVTDGEMFAQRLASDLLAVSHDRHLNVNFSILRIPDQPPGPNPDAAAQNRKRLEQSNCGFERVEVLPRNVGYLKFNGFFDPDICGPTVTAAISFLAHVDALIVDLRDNGGGSPKMVTFVASYLFDKPTHLNDLFDRKSNQTTEYWTLTDLPGPRLADTPVYVLTSRRTFSGAEEFTYDLKNQQRATIVGEVTGGGAHPVAGHRIDDHFTIGVPGARAINPITKTDWEGVGVEPDVKVPAADALTTAQKLAAEKRPSK
jgi:retinol-binding protein 3